MQSFGVGGSSLSQGPFSGFLRVSRRVQGLGLGWFSKLGTPFKGSLRVYKGTLHGQFSKFGSLLGVLGCLEGYHMGSSLNLGPS